MTELLALPGWRTPPTSLTTWITRLESLGLSVQTTGEEPGASWVEVSALRLRGYVVMQGQIVEAINFELHDSDTRPARDALESAAAAIGWEVHEEDEEDRDDDDDEDEDADPSHDPSRN